ncbi:SusC/RagA family TonB-linked outer membrane protein [Algibacter pacificus]|uniref:SusC/RagA family TonB-linked outer membrane protein n=1 Tax=Algibacter pacificus TaxID=2599389 RepID=UPI0011C7F8BC|nr:TonB-dependent receptor [Algibacter pacificus]
MKKNHLFLLMLSISWCSFSQNLISGVVKDNSGPMPGVNILEKGTSNGVVTTFDGTYEITTAKNAILVFSYLGYKVKEVEVSNEQNINVVMTVDTESLSEIVVVGYGRQKKESVLGAINQVKGEDVVNSGSPNIVNALNGVSPGLNVVQSSGQPGADEGQIFIRGNANPLILVDGVEIVGGFSNIDPRDVESISTLKDGAATAVYGIRGANGVIIITTKRGKIGKPKVSFNSQFAVKTVQNSPDMLNAYDAQNALNVGILNDQMYTGGYSSEEDLAHWASGDLPYIYPNTDWQDTLIEDYAFSTTQTVSLRGGNDFVKYYASAGYLEEGDITKTVKLFNYNPDFKFQRYSFRGNLDFTLTKSTRLKTSISSRLEDTNQPGNTGNANFIKLYQSAPGGLVPIYPAEIMEQYPDPLYPDGFSEYRFGAGVNLYSSINATGALNALKTVFSIDFELEQDLDFITEGLMYTGKYNYVSSYTTKSDFDLSNSEAGRIDTYTLNRDGSWFSFEGRNYERPTEFFHNNESITYNQEISYYRGQLNYKKSFNNHNVTGLAIFSRSKRVTGTEYPYFNEDWIGRFTYDYNSRYFFEASGAYNGDETFAKGQRFKFFPSFALGANLAKENFVKNTIPVLNNFKVRYSYGQTGDKSGLGNNRWQYLSFYDNIKSNHLRNRYYFGENINTPLTIIGESQIGNTELTWATVTKQNIGVDFGVFKNKFSGFVEFFKDEREGLIGRPTAAVPSYFGSSVSLPYANLGASESHGYEVSLTYKNKTSGGFSYAITGFYGFNENRVVISPADGAGTPEYSKLEGKPAGTTALLQTDGYFQNIDELLNYPEFAGNPGLGDYRYVDYNANGTVIGNDLQDQVRFDLPTSPKNSYSFKLNLGYKRWSLSALINGIKGHKGLVNSTLAYALPSGEATGRYDQLDYWTPSNPDAAYPALHKSISNPNLNAGTTARIINLDYIKLRSLNLAYNFDMSKSNSISVLEVYLNGNNLFTISDIDYGDPQGNSAGSYPILARFNLGLNISL